MAPSIGVGIQIGMPVGGSGGTSGKSAKLEAINLLAATSLRAKKRTVTGFASDAAYTDHKSVLVVADSVTAFNDYRQELNVDNAAYTYKDNPTLISARKLLDDSLSGANTDVVYIVSGDSTRDSNYNGMIDYYTYQLAKANVVVFDNAESGQSAQDWLNNEDQVTLQQAIDATTGDGEDTILEYSFGINDDKNGATRAEVKGWIKDGVVAYLAAKPLASVILVVPVYTGNTARNSNLRSIYQEVSSDLSLPLNDILGITEEIHGDTYYYFDGTHPNEIGSVRIVNYNLRWLSSSTTATAALTLDENYLEPTFTGNQAVLINTGFWNTTTGVFTENAAWRCLEEVPTTPGFAVRTIHQGNRTDAIFMDSGGAFISRLFTAPVGGEPYQEVIAPANAATVRINITSDGTAYDLLGDTPELYSEPAAPTMTDANSGLYSVVGFKPYDINGRILDEPKGMNNAAAGINKVIQSILPGSGTTPTGWALGGGTGTSLIKPSLFGDADGAQAVQNQATAERPFLSQTETLDAATTYFMSFLVEDIVILPVGTSLRISAGTGTLTGGSVGYTLLADDAGKRVGVSFTTVNAGTFNLRCGIGTSVNDTGDVTFSRPQIEEGTVATDFIPTGATEDTRNDDKNFIPIPATVKSKQFNGSFIFTPIDTAAVGAVVSSFVDANNLLKCHLNGTQAVFEGVLASVPFGPAAFAYATTALTPCEFIVGYEGTTLSVGARDVGGGSPTLATAAFSGDLPLASLLGLGTDSNGGSTLKFESDQRPIFAASLALLPT